jgi:hypothetical protein
VNTGKTLFARLMDFVPWTSFARIVSRYGGDARVRRFNCAEQFRVMAFAQLTWRESLRDIEAVLSANRNKLYGMGLRSAVHRSTLADANESRDWRIWADGYTSRSAKDTGGSEGLANIGNDQQQRAICLDSFGCCGEAADLGTPAPTGDR